jgi:glycosyl transferase family 4
MTERLVLIFAYHYPPENAIGGARPFRFAKYLSRLGYACRVYTAAEQPGRDDPSIRYVPDPFFTGPRNSRSWQLERAVRKLFFPGWVGMHWSFLAARAARGCVRAHPGAEVTIFSTFPPLGAHLAGWQLAGSGRWFADFRDPMRDERPDEHITTLQRWVIRWFERTVVRQASAVIANTDAIQVRWQEKYPSFRDKFQLMWNGFDPEERIQPLPIPSRNFRVLTHVGELYGGRNTTPILESIARLIAAKRFPKGSVHVRLIGPAQADCLPSPEFIQRARSEGWLDLVTEQIPRYQARQVAQTSDCLLLLQPQSAVQVPGKLFEYLQIGRPILAFIQPNSPTEQILKRSGVPYRCVYPGCNPPAMDDIVADFFDLPSTEVTPSSWFEEQFNAEHQTRMLDALIQHVQDGTKASSPDFPFNVDEPRRYALPRFTENEQAQLMKRVERFRSFPWNP